MKILVLGANGLLGSRLVPDLFKRGHEVFAASRNHPGCIQIDWADKSATLKVVQSVAPRVVVNLIGMTDVERCESHPKEAWQANVRSAELVAGVSKAVGAHLVHLSTDQVYDSSPNCSESDACPGNYYALTKYAGELAALSTNATVLRTNFFGMSHHVTRRSLTDWLFSALGDSRSVQVFEDVYFSPLSMGTLCGMINHAAEQQASGIFNVGSKSGMSKAEFAFSFAQAVGMPSSNFSRVSANESGVLKAWRPKNMCMNTSQFESTFKVLLPTLQSEIEQSAKEYRGQI